MADRRIPIPERDARTCLPYSRRSRGTLIGQLNTPIRKLLTVDGITYMVIFVKYL